MSENRTPNDGLKGMAFGEALERLAQTDPREMPSNDIVPHNHNGQVIAQRAGDGYINATAMCKAIGKEWSNYRKNDTTEAFLAALERSLRIRRDQLILSVSSGPNDQRGTWVHPQIAINLATWLSPEFAVQVSEWVVTWMMGIAKKKTPYPDFASLDEGEKRLYLRDQVTASNKKLADAARGSGVVTPQDFSIFQAYGYQGMYAGRGVKQIRQAKGLPDKAQILDHMVELKLYNTLTRQKESFVPLDPNHIRLYVCGPTVYDFAHIGNARPVIVFDMLFRLLRHLYGAACVTYARNITDVDDKINARAAQDFPNLPLNEAIRKVTEATNAQFQADVAALGCLQPTHQPRATDHIDKMIDMISRLLAKGYAYIAQGVEGREVLFSIRKMAHYGQLSNRQLDEQLEGARVAVEAHKQTPGDFVLWKESSADEPGWAAEFLPDQAYRTQYGVSSERIIIYGRPGWHIECSAMSMAKLLEPFGGGLSCDDPVKNTFDIHGGGIDLVFPHHENEIAQSCCAFGTEKMANIWMHNGFLQVEGQKMSKSLGNFVTINALRNTDTFGARAWSGQVLRWAMLRTHYRKPIDWTVSGLLESGAALQRLLNRAEGHTDGPVDPGVVAALSADLNTPAAIARIHQLKDPAVLTGSLAFLGFPPKNNELDAPHDL